MLYLGSLIAFLAALALMPLARWAALKVNFVDEPGGRKIHDEPAPPVGGLIVFPVYMAVVAALVPGAARLWPLFMGIIILLATGAYDEKRNLNPWIKFFIQMAVTLLVVFYGEAQIRSLGDLFGMGEFWLSFMSLPFSIAAVMLLINAINLIDGMDGLAGGYGFIVLFWLIVGCATEDDATRLMEIAPLMGALAGFLYYNMRSPLRRKASVFLGDAGSLSLGLALAYFCISLGQYHERTIEPVSVAWLLALPIMDTCAQFYRRVREGRHPFSPDCSHFHHHFIHAGIGPGVATAALLLLSLGFSATGFLAPKMGIPSLALTILWMALLLAHMEISRKPDRYIRLLSRFAKKAGAQ